MAGYNSRSLSARRVPICTPQLASGDLHHGNVPAKKTLRLRAQNAGKKPRLTLVAVLTLAIGRRRQHGDLFSVRTRCCCDPSRSAIRTNCPHLVSIIRNRAQGTFRIPFRSWKIAERAGVFDDGERGVVGERQPHRGSRDPQRLEFLAVSPQPTSRCLAPSPTGAITARIPLPGFRAGGGDQRRAVAPSRLGRTRYLLGNRALDKISTPVVVVCSRRGGCKHPGALAVGRDIELWATAGFRDLPFPSPPAERGSFRARWPGSSPGVTGSGAGALDDHGESAAPRERGGHPPQGKWNIEIQALQDHRPRSRRCCWCSWRSGVIVCIRVPQHRRPALGARPGASRRWPAARRWSEPGAHHRQMSPSPRCSR